MPERGRPITLLDLSKHTSALPSMSTNFSLFARPDPYAAYTEEQLYRFLSTHRLSREPGKQEYSNVGVALLGRLLARHAGMEYEPFLRERVLDPLGLASTSITPTEDQRRRLAPGHDRFLQPIETWEMRAMPASGSLRSTANDLLKFLAFNLGQRETPLYPAMTAQRTPMRALGWGRTKLGGDDVYGHDGGKAGYRSAAIFNPRTRTGVVVLTNARTDDRPMSLAAHLLFNGARLPPAPEAPKRPTMAALKPAQLERLSGRYRLEAGGMLAIARRDDHLLVDSLGDGVASFLPASPQDFFSNTEDEQISFEVEGEHAIGLVLTAAGKASKAARVGDL
jgi:CubicO group peptidase (beta-lactamase class C family)